MPENLTVFNFNTPCTNSMGADGFTWAAENVKVIDKFGKSIIYTENSVGDHFFTWSNDNELTWTDGTSQIALERGDFDYDPINDKVHALVQGSDPNDGLLYRRWNIARDGSNNILSMTRETGINTRIEFQGQDTSDPGAMMEYSGPRIIFISDIGSNGAVYIQWTARNAETANLGLEIRSSMRTLSNSTADDVLTNWRSPTGATSTSQIGHRPGGGALQYYALAVSKHASAPFRRPVSTAIRLSAGSGNKDLFSAFSIDTANDGDYCFKYARLHWNAGSSNWSSGVDALVTLSKILRNGTDNGYPRKWELITQFVYDSLDDFLFIAFPTWRDNGNGDTISVRRINVANNDLSAITDVYSADGAHSYAPTCDVVYDDINNRLGVSYIKTGTQFAAIETFRSNLVLDKPELIYYDAAPIDIPYIYFKRINNKFVSMFRTAQAGVLRSNPAPQASPYIGRYVVADWEAPEPEPGPGPPDNIGNIVRGRLTNSVNRMPREFPWMTEEQKREVRRQRDALLGR